MIENRDEHRRMHEVERQLWWYQTLHGKILAAIERQFGDRRTGLKILDAACGTGGLLSVLHDRGYTDLVGFDYSRHAIDFSRERGLDVTFGDLKNVADFRPGQTYDVIVCNDALYFLTDHEIETALAAFRARLNSGGILLINIHAFNAFAGTHDVAVGSTRRFTRADFARYVQAAHLNIVRDTYWPFFLSIPILAVRQWQRFQLKNGHADGQTVESDVRYPGDAINTVLKSVTWVEQKLIPRAPFGSSLFMVLEAGRSGDL